MPWGHIYKLQDVITIEIKAFEIELAELLPCRRFIIGPSNLIGVAALGVL